MQYVLLIVSHDLCYACGQVTKGIIKEMELWTWEAKVKITASVGNRTADWAWPLVLQPMVRKLFIENILLNACPLQAHVNGILCTLSLYKAMRKFPLEKA